MLRATQNETPPKQAWLLKLATTQLKVITKSARAKAAPNTFGTFCFLDDKQRGKGVWRLRFFFKAPVLD